MHKHKIWKKGLVLIIILLFIGMSVVPSTATIIQEKSIIPTNNGNTFYVGGSGPNNYTKIQDAINDSVDGDTIFVFDDSSPYYENLTIDKSINLIAENNNTRIIFDSKCVNINSDDVTIKGFRIISKYAIDIITQSNIIIQNNIIESNKGVEGINIWESKYCSILGNEISGFWKGINMYLTQDVNIFNNKIYDNDEYGLWLAGDTRANISNNIISNNVDEGIFCFCTNDVIIYNNTISFNEIGIFSDHGENPIYKNNIISYNKAYGIESFSDDNAVIVGNIVSYNVGCGIYKVSDGGLISKNIIFNNQGVGLEFVYDNNYILDNHIENNTGYGITLFTSFGSYIERNNLINNHINAYFEEFWLFRDLIFKPKRNIWNANYYSDIGSEDSYVIHGMVSFFFFINFKWITRDHNPAKEPYDIS